MTYRLFRSREGQSKHDLSGLARQQQVSAHPNQEKPQRKETSPQRRTNQRPPLARESRGLMFYQVFLPNSGSILPHLRSYTYR